MPRFRRRKERAPTDRTADGGGREPLGHWERLMEKDQQELMLQCVLTDLRSRGFTPEVTGRRVIIEHGGEPMTVGLDNIAQVCLQEPAEVWHEVVRRHFDGLQLDALQGPAAFDDIRDRMRIQLYASSLTVSRTKMISRLLTPSVMAAAVIDYPTLMRSVSSADLERWNISEDLAFAAAMEATSWEPQPEREDIGDRLAGGFSIFHGESFYAASHVLRLDTVMADLPEAGALVMIPNRHVFGVHPIRSASECITAVGSMLPLASELFHRGPGSVIPGLLWWRQGTLTDLPAALTPERTEFHPPDAFVEVLGTLRP